MGMFGNDPEMMDMLKGLMSGGMPSMPASDRADPDESEDDNDSTEDSETPACTSSCCGPAGCSIEPEPVPVTPSCCGTCEGTCPLNEKVE